VANLLENTKNELLQRDLSFFTEADVREELATYAK